MVHGGPKNMYYTYLLLLSNNKIYAGYSADLKIRIREHSQGKVKSTKNYRPLQLIFYEAFISQKDAERREKYFKSNKGKKMIKVILKEYFSS